jgi:uncharacterized membrane protein YhiD involved in acid resistance
MNWNTKLIAGLVLVGLLAAVLILASVFGAFSPDDGTPVGQADVQTSAAGQTAAVDERPLLMQIFEDSAPPAGESLATTTQIVFRLLLAVILSGILAFRPRKNVPLFKRSLFVSQTQILLSVVAAALMMIVGDNAARAFAIFAAVSLVRFRTNIRDPKEITVLLISLALGLAAGVGRWDLGVALCLFALALLWLLEFNESEQTFRSMELSVKTRNPEKTQKILKKIFKRMKIDAEVREIEPPDEKHQIGSIIYYLNMRLTLTTDRLTEHINSADPQNIEGIQWSKTKNASDIYQ